LGGEKIEIILSPKFPKQAKGGRVFWVCWFHGIWDEHNK